jgi:hypothetical protein
MTTTFKEELEEFRAWCKKNKVIGMHWSLGSEKEIVEYLETGKVPSIDLDGFIRENNMLNRLIDKGDFIEMDID